MGRHDPPTARRTDGCGPFRAALKRYRKVSPPRRQPVVGSQDLRDKSVSGRVDDPAGGAKLLAVSAQEGDPIAQRSLGYLVQHGIGAAQDDIRAASLYQAAADAGDDIAAFNLGVLSGRSPHAVHWLRRTAEAGITEAYPLLGDRLSDRDLDEEALQWYVRGAEAGDKGSMYAAACWYRDGFGGPVNLVQALRWYLAMLDVGSGNGIHEAHAIVPRMTAEEIYEAGRLSGRLLEADLFVQRQASRSAASG